MSTSIIVLTGPPGSGKTTIGQRLAQLFRPAVCLHTDDFWHSIVTGAVPPYLPEADDQNQTVMEVIAGAAFSYAAGGFTTVVDGIIGPWMLHHFQDLMDCHPRIPLHYIVLFPDSDIVLSRATARTSPNALTDTQPILGLWEQFADLGTLSSHSLDTSHDSPADTVQRVFAAVQTKACQLPDSYRNEQNT